MKIIGNETYSRKKRRRANMPVWLQPFLPRVRWTPSESVLQEMERLLDDRFTLLCDVHLEGVDSPIPYILIGPSGVFVLLISEARGMYRAVKDRWEVFDFRSKKYKNARPNLLHQAEFYARQVEEKLLALEENMPAVQAVLLFADPGVHVDTEQPRLRLVLMDAIPRLAMNISQGEKVFDRERMKRIMSFLLHGGDIQFTQEEAELQDAFSLREIDEKKPRKPAWISRLPSEEPEVIKKVYRRTAWSRRQWVIFWILVVVNILILSALVLLVWLSA